MEKIHEKVVNQLINFRKSTFLDPNVIILGTEEYQQIRESIESLTYWSYNPEKEEYCGLKVVRSVKNSEIRVCYEPRN